MTCPYLGTPNCCWIEFHDTLDNLVKFMEGYPGITKTDASAILSAARNGYRREFCNGNFAECTLYKIFEKNRKKSHL